MYYTINVTLNGCHYFGTHKRSLLTYTAAISMLKDFRSRFPSSKGFEVTLSRHDQHSVQLDA